MVSPGREPPERKCPGCGGGVAPRHDVGGALRMFRHSSDDRSVSRPSTPTLTLDSHSGVDHDFDNRETEAVCRSQLPSAAELRSSYPSGRRRSRCRCRRRRRRRSPRTTRSHRRGRRLRRTGTRRLTPPYTPVRTRTRRTQPHARAHAAATDALAPWPLWRAYYS